MAERSLSLDLFVEDAAQERLLSALIRRVSAEDGRHCSIRTVLARGGQGRVLKELALYLRASHVGAPDAVVIGVDANCKGWNEARGSVEAVMAGSSMRAVIACPDPHIERWYLGDPPALADALGLAVAVPKRKCDRDAYKNLLTRALLSGGNVVTLGGIEYAEEIVDAMDLFRAGKAEPSLRHFITGLRAVMRGP
jgi:hypothetical protein